MTEERSLIDRIAAIDPTFVALRGGNRTLTYGELNRAAKHLAEHLAALGATPGTSVAICLERSFDQIISLLGTMRAGAAFVPIDPHWPDARIQHVLQDSGARVFIAPASLSERIGAPAPSLDPEAWKHRADSPDLPALSTPEQVGEQSPLAYIIYTSGSTGVPKGVEITRSNLEHLIAWHLAAFQVTSADRASHLAGLAFDAAVWEIWPYLSVGASISLADSLTRNDPALLQHWLLKERITVSFVPTVLAESLVTMVWPADTPLRVLLTGGDTLHTAPLPGLPFAFVNNYGPTECTVVATSALVPGGVDGLPSIGSAIAGTTLYLLDDRLQPVAEGEIGQIFVGGAGVGAGYRKLPEQTAQSFLPDPFSPLPTARMFKTGDMALRLPNGQLSFRGRRDTQEKIRGFRIELDEIAHVLNRHPEVAFCTVLVRTDPAMEKSLVAYIVPSSCSPLGSRDLREFAARALPDYMIPTTFVRLEAIPLSFNGKIDHRALPEATPDNTFKEISSREPESEVERILLQAVRGVLHNDRVGLDDDFFLVGGHSLMGTQVVLRARETFGVMLTLRDLFEAPTVALLASRIEALLIEQLEDLTEEEALELAGQASDREHTA